MRIVFFGTPAYVIPVLEMLHKTFKSDSGKSPIAAVVTQPPKPVGRKKRLEFSPVDDWAHKRNIMILRFLDIGKMPKADLGILASYGNIIPPDIINHFPKGILNIHPSILPQFRGSSPVQATIISGSEAGVTIIKLDEKLDHGPIISQFKDEVLSEDTTETLRNRLFKRSAEVLISLIPAYLQGKITPREQDHSKASYTREIKKEDAFIPPEFIDAALRGHKPRRKWQIPFIKDYSPTPDAHCLERFVRSMQPWPIAWTLVKPNSRLRPKDSKRLKILKTHLEPITNHQSLITHHKLVLDEVQLEGRNVVSWKRFGEGYPNTKFV